MIETSLSSKREDEKIVVDEEVASCRLSGMAGWWSVAGSSNAINHSAVHAAADVVVIVGCERQTIRRGKGSWSRCGAEGGLCASTESFPIKSVNERLGWTAIYTWTSSIYSLPSQPFQNCIVKGARKEGSAKARCDLW